MSVQLDDDVLQDAVDALHAASAEAGGPNATPTKPPSPLVLVGITAVLCLVLYIMTEIGNYFEITRNWAHYQCHPAVAPFAKFYGHDPTETMNFCIGQAVKQHAGSVITPIYKGIEQVSSTVDGAYDKVKSIESGVGGLLQGFNTFVVNFQNSFRLIGVRIQMSVVSIKEIFQRVFAIFVAFTYAGMAALTFGENLVCNPLVTFIGDIAGVDICCFAPETRVRMADGSTQAIQQVQIDDELAGGARVSSTFLFDGAAGCAGMVSIHGVHVSGNHYLRTGPSGPWIRADAHPAAVPVPTRPLIWCLGTTTNTIPVVSVDGGDLWFTDYEETSDPAVVAAAQALSEHTLNGFAGPTVADYSLGLSPHALVAMEDGGWRPLSAVRPGDRVIGGARVIGVVSEICESVCLEQGMSAAQLVQVDGRWERAGRLWAATPSKLIMMHLVLDKSWPLWVNHGGVQWIVRDYTEIGEAGEAPYEAWLQGTSC